MTSQIVLGVSGGIACYKAVEVLRGLTEAGHEVRVVPTAAALKFVGEPTWAALSGHRVATSCWEESHEVPHVRLGQQSACVLVAPATADLLARATHGIANDLLTNVLLTARCPIIVAPAMHTEMWLHPATSHNVELLRQRGVIVLEPATGRLTGTDSGPGRFPEPMAVVAAVLDVLRRKPSGDLAGRRVVISAGGTQEALDPVRYLGNRSSGRQGIELARTAVSRGAVVTLVAAHIDFPAPAGVRLIRVGTAEELHHVIGQEAKGADAVVMAAAVADFRPSEESALKIKKESTGASFRLTLTQTTDVLAALVANRSTAVVNSAPDNLGVIVGFAAETAADQSALEELGRRKLKLKGCDLLVVNDVGRQCVFGSDSNEVVILSRSGSTVQVGRQSKAGIADAVWDAVLRQWESSIPLE